MANVLSQEEIDALLNAMSTGEEEAVVVEDKKETGCRIYDFRTANKFSKEQIKTLNIIFENYANLLSTKLTSVLRTLCDINVSSIEEQKFGEFNNSIPSPSIIAIINADPFASPYITCVSAKSSYAMISRVFGGSASAKDIDKPFTEIEQAVMKNIVKMFTADFKTAWEKIVAVSPALDRIETSSQFTQVVALNEPVALITFEIKIDEVEDMAYICLPYIAIQSILKKLNSTAWTLGNSYKTAVVSKRDIIENDMNDTVCELTAEFKTTKASFYEIATMKVGDIMCLDHSINQYITVNLENTPKFQGIVGVSGNKKVIQIAKIFKESNEE